MHAVGRDGHRFRSFQAKPSCFEPMRWFLAELGGAAGCKVLRCQMKLRVAVLKTCKGSRRNEATESSFQVRCWQPPFHSFHRFFADTKLRKMPPDTAARCCPTLPDAARCCPKLPDATRMPLALPITCPKAGCLSGQPLPDTARSCPKLPEAARCCPMLPDVARKHGHSRPKALRRLPDAAPIPPDAARYRHRPTAFLVGSSYFRLNARGLSAPPWRSCEALAGDSPS